MKQSTQAQVLGRASAAAVVGAGKLKETTTQVLDKGKSAVQSVADQVSTSALEKKEKFKQEVKKWLLEVIFEQMDKLVDRGPRIMKHYLDDPDMPQIAKRFKDRAVDLSWPDIKEEIMWEVAKQLDSKEITDPEGPGSDCCRAFFRYHMYPHDKTIWGRVRDVFWWMFTIGSLIPISGFYSFVYFLIFLIIDKGDEYQLLQFILQFKGTQFISHGVIRTVMGFFIFVNCVTAGGRGDHHECEEEGPGMYGSYIATLLGWVLQVVLVWAAYACMRKSTQKGRRELKGTITGAVTQNGSTGEVNRTLDRTGKSQKHGGYIKYFLIYDAICFLLCVGGLVVVIVLRDDGDRFQWDHWTVKHAFFSCQVIYGFCSMPFFLFLIPVLTRFLTHSIETAYDRKGRCREFVGPAQAKNEDDGEKKSRWGAMFESNMAQFSATGLSEKVEQLYEKAKVVMLGGASSGPGAVDLA